MASSFELTRARAKIVATIGPASLNATTIEALLEAGMNVARLNCAHGSPENLMQMLGTLRDAASRKRVPLAVLADLAGPKLRVGTFVQGQVELEKGAKFVLTTNDVEGTPARVSVNHPGFSRDVHEGDDVFLNDGLIHLIVERIDGSDVHTRVEVGGVLSDRKGVSVPAAEVSMPSVTEKDWGDVDLLAGKVDYLSLSFVRSAEDIRTLRDGLTSRGHVVPIVAKIEKSQAVERLDAIIEAADALMVARGDLGVECPIERVPTLQKKIIAACQRAGKPVITATQMLESMVANPRPTRAEASDVANAVLDGSDALMLSAETASGRYPVEAVKMMRKIVLQTEDFARGLSRPNVIGGDASIGSAVGHGASVAAETIDAALIICLTKSGATARNLARWRPKQPILAVTPLDVSARQLSLVWGVEPWLEDIFEADFDRVCGDIVARLRKRGTWPAGAKVVITAGLPFSARGRTNTLRIEEL